MRPAPVPTPLPTDMVSSSPAPTDVAPALPTNPVPMPSNTWLVNIVEDSTTEPWTVAAFWSGLFFGLASLAVGVGAVYLAAKANSAAVKAADEAERANLEASKARAAVAMERRRTFQLEILRGMLEDLAEGATFVRQVAGSAAVIKSVYAGRLPMLDEHDLPLWRQAATASRQEIIDLVGGPTEEDTQALNHPVAYYPARTSSSGSSMLSPRTSSRRSPAEWTRGTTRVRPSGGPWPGVMSEPRAAAISAAVP